jgi:type IV pilus biogenesis protein CpaD/CtpE
METVVVRNSEIEKITVARANIEYIEYREAVRKQLNDEVKKIIDIEILKSALEIREEHKKAMKQIIEDYRSAIRQIVEEEKVEIWRKAETLKKSMLKLEL